MGSESVTGLRSLANKGIGHLKKNVNKLKPQSKKEPRIFPGHSTESGHSHVDATNSARSIEDTPTTQHGQTSSANNESSGDVPITTNKETIHKVVPCTVGASIEPAGADETSESGANQPPQGQPNAPTFLPRSAPIWDKALKQFAVLEPDLYSSLEAALQKASPQAGSKLFELASSPNIEESKLWKYEWARKLQAYLPTMRLLQGLTATLSSLDPHKIAPLICSAVFFAIQIALDDMDPKTRDKLLNILMSTTIFINQWITYEVLSLARAKDAISTQTRDLEMLLPTLYHNALNILGSIHKGTQSRGWRAGLRIKQKDAVWESDYAGLQRQHSSCTALKDEAELILKAQDENRKVLDWIEKSDGSGTSQRNVKQQTGLDVEGTEAGKWFLETSEFRTWLLAVCSNVTLIRTFWLRGIMGTGKTTLICRVIAHLLDLPIANSKIIYYYCYASSAQGSGGPDYETIVRALCHQLAWNTGQSLAKPATTFHDFHTSGTNSSPTIRDWEILLCDLIRGAGETPAVFILDAIDECKSPTDIDKLLKLLGRIQQQSPSVQIMLSSRPHINISDYFKTEHLQTFGVVAPAARNDMTTFIKSQISLKKTDPVSSQSIFFKQEGQDLLARLENALSETAGGMYRWVEVWLGVFFPFKRIYLRAYAEKKLDAIEHHSLEGLDDEKKGESLQTAYGHLWDANHDEQDDDIRILLFRLLLCAYRALTADELCEAINFNISCANKDGENSTNIKPVHLKKLYHNFLRASASGELEFEHLSAKTFVEGLKEESSQLQERKSQEILFSPPRNHLAMADLAVKAMMRPEHQLWRNHGFRFLDWATQLSDPKVFENLRDEFRDGLQGDEPNDPLILPELLRVILGKPRNNIAQYLGASWVRHCRKVMVADGSIAPMIRRLLQNPSSGFDGWCLSYGVLSTGKSEVLWEFRSEFQPEDGTSYSDFAWYVAWQCLASGQTKIAPHLLLSLVRLGLPLYTKKNDKENGLSWVPLHTIRNLMGETALHIATGIGNATNIRHLLEFERKQSDNMTTSGDLLLFSKDAFGHIPLHDAVSADVIKILLEFEASDAGWPFPPPTSSRRKSQLLECKTFFNETPLVAFVRAGDTVLFEWLLERYELDLNQKDYSGDSLLTVAKKYRSQGVVESLKKLGVADRHGEAKG